MSRQPSRSQSASTVAPPDIDADELHRIAVARRQARTGNRQPATTKLPQAQIPTSSLPQVFATTVPVAGMTCRSCEVRIERQVGRLPGVARVSASSTRGRVEIESSAPIPQAAIAEAIHKAGYEIGTTPWLERDPSVWITAAAGVALIAGIALIAQVTGVAELANKAGDLAQGGVLVALLLGLAAGVSTCMALVGGLVLALSASYQARRARAGLPEQGRAAQMRPALVFMGGRILGYAAFGALLGAIGASLTMPPAMTAALMIAAAVVMTLIGARLTGLSPRVATWSPTLPPSLARNLGLAETDAGGYSDVRAAGLGALSFFMPCGFTQAVQIYALSTGSPATAGMLMAAFAIGTAPGLLVLAGLPVVVPSRARPTLLRLVGVVVLGFAVVNAGAGLRLAGVHLSPFGTSVVAATTSGGTAATTNVPATGSGSGAGSGSGTGAATGQTAGYQDLRTYQEVDGYQPANVEIVAGIPTHWTIESASTRSCAASLVVPELGIQVRLQKGDNVIELPAMNPGTLAYTCSMGMYGGTITIVDGEAGSPVGRG
jgi:sulfite exporter TauE/SafE/copper chaperone CopZ